MSTAISPLNKAMTGEKIPDSQTKGALAQAVGKLKNFGGQISKAYSTSENIVSVGFVPERFIFTVETSGALPPEQIVESALTQLVAKMGVMALSAQHAISSAPSFA